MSVGDEEIWAPIEGYEGWYEVSTKGNVRSVDRVVTYSNGTKHFYKGKMLKLKMDSCETHKYPHVTLQKNSVKKELDVHRLVAETFIPNPDNLPQVNHKDLDVSNCSVDNLEWISVVQNQRHRYEYRDDLIRRYEEWGGRVERKASEVNGKLLEFSETMAMTLAEECNITEDQILLMLSDYREFISKSRELNDLIYGRPMGRAVRTQTTGTSPS